LLAVPKSTGNACFTPMSYQLPRRRSLHDSRLAGFPVMVGAPCGLRFSGPAIRRRKPEPLCRSRPCRRASPFVVRA